MVPSYVANHWRNAGLQSPRVRKHTQYLLSLKVYRPGSNRNDLLAGRILTQAAACILCNGTFKPGLAALAGMHGVSVRTVTRAVQALKLAGLIEVRRRGRKLSNVYRLARWLWCKLTGAHPQANPWLPGLAPLLPDVQVAIDSARAKWQTAQGGVALATR